MMKISKCSLRSPNSKYFPHTFYSYKTPFAVLKKTVNKACCKTTYSVCFSIKKSTEILKIPITLPFNNLIYTRRSFSINFQLSILSTGLLLLKRQYKKVEP